MSTCNDCLGILAATTSMVISGIGIPCQMIRTKRTGERVSLVLVGTTTTSYLMWGLYGWTMPTINGPLALAQTFGLIMSTSLLIQTILTPKK